MFKFSLENGIAFFSQLIVVILITSGSVFPQNAEILKRLAKKDSVCILVTDSGLGGYSVAAGLDSVISANKTFKNAHIIFCNALPRSNFRYNELPDAKAKADTFSLVLHKMQALFNPDIILIACNTLSVVYPYTEYAKTTDIPVIGIVELGVKVITDSLNNNPNSSIIVLGTETTIQSSAHKDMLLKNHIAEGRIVTKACPNLESEIQADPASDMTTNLIEFYLDELPQKQDTTADTKTFAALCCTHYGFSKPAFEQKLHAMYGKAQIINPNDEMIRMFSMPGSAPVPESKVTISVYSQAIISPEEKDGIGKLIRTVSPKAAKSLDAYTVLKGIF